MNTPFPIKQVAVIGAGTMGRGIVISLANAGLRVDAARAAAEKARAEAEPSGKVPRGGGRVNDCLARS